MVAVIAASVAAFVVVLTAIGIAHLVVDPDPEQPSGEPRSERWLVDHLSRVRGIRHVIGAFDRKVWGGAMVALGLFSVIAAAALVGWLLSTVDSNRGFARFDESAAEWGSANATDASTAALRWITHLGGTAALIPVMAVVGLVAAYRHRRHDHPRWGVLGFLLTVGVGIVILNNALKWIVDRERPTVEHLASAGGSSFPSGHSAAAAACWAAIALVAARRLPSGRRRRAAAAAAAIAVAVAASRVLLGVHWLTDVIAGVTVGWTWFFVVALVFGGRLQQFGHPAAELAEQAAPSPDDVPIRHEPPTPSPHQGRTTQHEQEVTA